MVQQKVLDGKVEILRALRAQMADGTVHQLQARLNGALANFLDGGGVADAFHFGVRAEVQIDGIHIVDGLLGQRGADERGQVAADLIVQRELAVGKRARAGKARGDMAVGLAADAAPGFILGTVPLFHGLALFHNDDLLAAAALDHFKRSEDARRAGADDDHVAFHITYPPSRAQRYARKIKSTV